MIIFDAHYQYPQLIISLFMFRNLVWRSVAAASSLLLGGVYCKQRKHDVYIWGNGDYQARPDALLQFHNFYPKKINNLPADMASLHFGQYYEAGIDSHGQLFIWNKHRVDANVDQNNKDQMREGIMMIQKDVKSVKFTSGYIWTLDKDGKVHQFPILKKFDQNNNMIEKSIGERREVEPLRGTIQLQTGRDHLLALSQKGEVFAMGDDTYGQCGQADADRNTCPPFVQKRIKFPHKVKNLSEVVSISTGEDHNLALDKLGNLFGWGSNSNLQISHEQEFSKMNNPLICSYSAIKISKNLDHNIIKKIVAGGEFSVVVTENKQTKSNEVYTFGSNLRGQLAIDEVKHFKDISKVSKLSNYVMKVKGVDKKVEIEQLQCGKNHCIALLNIGYIMEWGDNEQGQMGNKKRSPSMVPIILRDFIGKKVVGVFAGEYNSGVIVEGGEESN